MEESVVSGPVSAEEESSIELPEALQEPTHSKNLLFLALYGVANMVIGVVSIALASVLLPLQLGTLVTGDQTGVFSLILGVGSVASVLTNPLVGMFSDRTTSRFGRRRPWLIAGGVSTVIVLFCLSVAPSLIFVAITWIFLQIAINLVQASLSSIIPDQIPVHQRATVSAFGTGVGVMVGGLIGQILIAQVFKGVQAAYSAIAVTATIMLVLFLIVLREKPLPREFVRPFRVKDIFAAFYLNPKAYPDLFLTWLARCLMFLGYTTVVNFIFYYLQDDVHYAQHFPGQTTAQGVQMFFAAMVGSILLASLVGGIISDKLERRKVFVIAAGLVMMVALLLYGLFPSWTIVIIATIIEGLGMGTFLAVDLALASQVLSKPENRGKDIGIINTAIFLPMILSPVIAGIALNALHSYLVLFVILAVATVLSALLVIPIKGVR